MFVLIDFVGRDETPVVYGPFSSKPDAFKYAEEHVGSLHYLDGPDKDPMIDSGGGAGVFEVVPPK
jgi:hypothetical protein